MIVYLDSETFSSTPIKNGVHAYSDADDAEVMLLQWAVDDGPVQIADLTAGDTPDECFTALDLADRIVIQNSGFDRTVIRKLLGYTIEPERIDDTMVNALAHGLPGGLDKLCAIFQVPTDKAKDKRGKELIQLFCKPRPKSSKLRRATRDSHPVEWQQFLDYAGSDILAMREIYKRCPKWSFIDCPTEHALWCRDQRINDRGFQVDVELAEQAVRAIADEKERLKERTRDNTDGELESTTQRDKLLKYVLSLYNVELPNLQAGTLERRIEDPDLPEPLRELLRIRLEASQASNAKFGKMLQVISPDGRMRGGLQFAGAARTARWSGRLFQPQNLPRPIMSSTAIETFILAVKAQIEDLVYILDANGNLLSVSKGLSNCLRGLIVAGPGKKLVASDLSNIEGRVLAWLANETWKLDAFRDYDAGTGPDLYCLMAAVTLGKRWQDVTKMERQLYGKVPELACGYQGAVGAFGTMAKLYGLELSEQQILKIVGDWRKQNENIRTFWADLESAMREAILTPGLVTTCRKIKFQKVGAWLKAQLPSGRFLSYARPKVHGDGHVSYWGMNSYTRRWEEIDTYGGKAAENLTQAIARDVMAANMPRIEAVGFEIVLTVHDEVISEAPDGDDTLTAELHSALLATKPGWLDDEDLPLAAAGFEGYRYRKED